MAGSRTSGGRRIHAKSTQLHVLRGTFRKDRHVGREIAVAPPGVPTPPKSLKGDARAEWDRMVKRLGAAKTLSILDDAVLYQYAQLFAETEQLRGFQRDTRRLVAELRRAIVRVRGKALAAAILEIAKLQALVEKGPARLRQQRLALRQFLVELGMTPASRSRVDQPTSTPQRDARTLRFFEPQRKGTP